MGSRQRTPTTRTSHHAPVFHGDTIFAESEVVGGSADGDRNGERAGPADDGGIDELGSTVEVEGAEIEEDPDEDDLLGGLKIDTTAELEIPDRLVDQVI